MKYLPIEKINTKLEECGQTLRVVYADKGIIKLNNSLILEDSNDIKVVYNRILKGKAIWSVNYDNIYLEQGIDAKVVKHCRSIITSEHLSNRFNIKKFNNILRTQNQKLRAVKITGKQVKLSNNMVLESERQVRLCKNHIMQGNIIWAQHFDKMYDNEDTIEIIQFELGTKLLNEGSSLGGINCQKLHGDNIAKYNLTGGAFFKKGNKPWNKGLNKSNNKVMKKLSENRKGSGNPMYGVSMSDDDKLKKSKMMKQKILDGNFTPNSNNRNTHWESTYNNKKYRSSWEALYQSIFPDDEFEKLRIKYIFEGKEYVYIVDFVNHNTKTATEVKPLELCENIKTKTKLAALKEWCLNREYKFILADKLYLIAHPKPKNMLLFDNKTKIKIEGLYEANKKNSDR